MEDQFGDLLKVDGVIAKTLVYDWVRFTLSYATADDVTHPSIFLVASSIQPSETT
jgi:hypothetical protein